MTERECEGEGGSDKKRHGRLLSGTFCFNTSQTRNLVWTEDEARYMMTTPEGNSLMDQGEQPVACAGGIILSHTDPGPVSPWLTSDSYAFESKVNSSV